jgi:hypothetical protein
VRRLLAEICALFGKSLSLVLLLWFFLAIGGRISALPLLELFSSFVVDYLGKRRFTLPLLGLGKDSILLLFHCLVTRVI